MKAHQAFDEAAKDDPYAFVDKDLLEGYLESVDIEPIDATTDENVASDMTWAQSHIGGGGPLTITDYGRHRKNNDTWGDFVDMVRDKMLESPGTQYLKFMDDDKDTIADTLVAISKENGYVVMPKF